MAGNHAVFQAAMRQGHTLAWELKWEAATREYQRALAERPDDAAATVSLAVALAKLGDNFGALEMYRRAVELLPEDAPALAGLAEIELKVGNVGAASASLARLLLLYLTQGQPERARQNMARLEEMPTPPADVLRAIVAASARAELGDIQRWASDALDAAASQVDSTESLDDGAEADSSSLPESEPIAHRPSASGTPESGERRPAAVVAMLASLDEVEQRRAAGDRPGASRALAHVRAAGSEWCIHPDEMLDVPVEARAAVAAAMLDSAADIRAHRPVAARDACWGAISAAPSFLPAQMRLAEVDVEEGRVDAAVMRLESVFDLYTAQSRGKSAASAFGWILRLRENDPLLRARLVDLYLAEGLIEQAVAHLKVLVAEASAAGESAQVLQLLERAVTIQPANFELWLDHFRQLVSSELWPAATARSEAIYERFPKDARALGIRLAARAWSQDIAGVDAAIPEVSEAVETGVAQDAAWIAETRDFLDVGPGEEVRQYALGRLALAVGDHQMGRALLAETATGTGRTSLPSATRLVDAARSAADLGEERRWLERTIELLESAPTSADSGDQPAYRDQLLTRLAEVCGASGDTAGRARALEALAQGNPTDENLFAQLAECYFQLGDVGRAATQFAALADLYDRNGDAARALGADQARLALTPDDATLLARLGDRYFSLDLVAEGEASYREATKSAARLGLRADAARYLKVLIEHASGHDQRRALAYREQLVKLAPGDWAARRELAAAYLTGGRASRAFAEYRAVAQGLSAAGDWQAAAEVYDEALKLNPWDTAVMLDLARTLATAGQLEDARRRIEQLLAVNPSDRGGLELLEELESAGKAG